MGDREQIEVLDAKVARLKVEYEQYFARVLKREPVKLRDEIERTILALNNKVINNTSTRFKLNSLVAKYTSYKQYWTRVLRAIDEGTYVRKAEGVPDGPIDKAPPEPPVPAAKPSAAARSADDNGVAEVYAKFLDARRECNEPVEGITMEFMKKTMDQYRKKVEEQYKTSNLEFKVSIKDGHARLSVTPKKAS